VAAWSGEIDDLRADATGSAEDGDFHDQVFLSVKCGSVGQLRSVGQFGFSRSVVTGLPPGLY
jgi:hypothetical protein